MQESVLCKVLIFSILLKFVASNYLPAKVQQLKQEVKFQQNPIETQQNDIQNLQKKDQTQENEIQSQKSKTEKEYQECYGLAGMLSLINSYHQNEPSCSILRTKLPSAPSGMYFVRPQGLKTSVQVHCDMTSKNGVGVTEIGHDSESRTYVYGHEAAGSYKRKIKYHLPMEQIAAIMKQSKHCEQFIKYECFGSLLTSSSRKSFNRGWWVSRQGSKMNYWGGAAVNSGKCACGMTNSCAGGKKCNCDKNDRKWRQDSGYLTDKNTLPVSELRFGDTGYVFSSSERESGYHTVGKLRCWG